MAIKSLLNALAIQDWISMIIAGLTVVGFMITIAIFITQEKRNAEIKTLEIYNAVFEKTFALRNKLRDASKLDTFYFSVAEIKTNAKTENTLMDFLSEMEDFACGVLQRSYSLKYLKKLMTPKLFQRLIVLIPYIDYKREEMNYSRLYTSYYTLVRKCQKHIRGYIDWPRPAVWVGPRASDTLYSGIPLRSISQFSAKRQKNKFTEKRQNQNIMSADQILFYRERLERAAKKDAGFYFYNQLSAYSYKDAIFRRCRCLNDLPLLLLLKDKLKTRELLGDTVTTLPLLQTGNIAALKKMAFDKLRAGAELIVQNAVGGGGMETFVLTKDYTQLPEEASGVGNYFMTEYISQSVSVNIHAVISEFSQLITPGSIQIIEASGHKLLYRGADFPAYLQLPEAVRCEIYQTTARVCRLLRSRGYRGILGIDYLVTAADKVYFMEINSRFQASTILIDKFLRDTRANGTAEAPSLLRANVYAFKGLDAGFYMDYNERIPYSLYYYYNEPDEASLVKADYIYKRLLNCKDAEVIDDGYRFIENPKALQPYAYLFRCIFRGGIAVRSPDGVLWVNDNVRTADELGTYTLGTEEGRIHLKIALLNQGIAAIEGSRRQRHTIKQGVFSSVDIRLFDDNNELYVNCPYKIRLTELSPFRLCYAGSRLYLYRYTERLAEASIELQKKLPYPADKILTYSGDRIRVKLKYGCDYKNKNLGCRFCNMPCDRSDSFRFEDAANCIKHISDLGGVQHFMIGGGSDLSPEAFGHLMAAAQILSAYKRPVSLMCLPIGEKEKLESLRAAGVTDVSFNMEIIDPETAARLMPGKGAVARETYWDALRTAVTVWPSYGDVRSLIMVGLERTETLLAGALKLYEMGVMPVLSVFRPLAGSPLAGGVPPSNAYLNRLLSLFSERLGLEKLGPKCSVCKNNTLAV